MVRTSDLTESQADEAKCLQDGDELSLCGHPTMCGPCFRPVLSDGHCGLFGHHMHVLDEDESVSKRVPAVHPAPVAASLMTVGAVAAALSTVSFSDSNEMRLDSGGYLGYGCGIMLEGTQGRVHFVETPRPQTFSQFLDERDKTAVSVEGPNSYRRLYKQELVNADDLNVRVTNLGEMDGKEKWSERTDRGIVGVIRIRSTIILSTCDETAVAADINADVLTAAAQDRLSGDAASESVWLAPQGSPQIDVAEASPPSAKLAAAPESGFALVPSNHPGVFRVGVQLGADLLGPLADASPTTSEWLDGQADGSLLITIEPDDANDQNYVAVPMFLALLNDCERPSDHSALASLLAWVILGGPPSWPLPTAENGAS